MIEKMKKNIVVMFFAFALSAYGQSEVKIYRDSIKQVIKNDFSSIEPKDLRYLVPFKQDKHSYLVNSKTQERVTQENYDTISFFNVSIRGIIDENLYFEYNGITKELDFYDEDKVNRKKVAPQALSMNGIDIGVNGELISYSNQYTQVDSTFLYQLKYYAVVKKDNKYGIIDRLGTPLNGFDFNYDKITLIDNLYGRQLFLVENAGKQSFKYINGNEFVPKGMLEDVVVKTSHSDFFVNEDYITRYYGYAIVSNGEKSGVLNLLKNRWFIKPQDKFDIIRIEYASDSVLRNTYDLNNRAKLTFYYLVQRRGDPEEVSFYVNEKLIPIHEANNEYIQE